MKNIVGQVPRGENFYQRQALIKKIYRSLDAGSDIFLSAPRRVGKTSIMRYLQDNSQDNYCFVYVLTESVHSTEEFFERLLGELRKSNALGSLSKASEKTRSLFNGIFDRVKSIDVGVGAVEFNDREAVTCSSEFGELLTALEAGETRIVIMIDEFPQAVENIRTKCGTGEAIRFLQLNRELRQQSNGSVKFIYTGSIGLPVVVKRLSSTKVINDLSVVEVTALSPREGTELSRMLLDEYSVDVEPEAIEYLLDKLEWLIPFNIQLAAQEIIDIYESTEEKITRNHVDLAFVRMCHRRNDIYFDSYYSRLEDAFDAEELPFVLALLNKASVQPVVNVPEIAALANQHHLPGNYNGIVDSLTFDGYLNNNGSPGEYRFTSPILKNWWARYVNH